MGGLPYRNSFTEKTNPRMEVMDRECGCIDFTDCIYGGNSERVGRFDLDTLHGGCSTSYVWVYLDML